MSWESDSELSNLYGRGAREEPPAWLDRAIEAAARDEAASRQPAAGRPFVPRWQASFALAAVLVVAVSVHWWGAPPDAELMVPPAARTPSLPPQQMADRNPDGSPSPMTPGGREDRLGTTKQSDRRLAQVPELAEGTAASEAGAASPGRAVEPLASRQAAAQSSSPLAAADQPTQHPRSDASSPLARNDSLAAPPPAAPAPARSIAPSARVRAEEAKAKEGPLVGQASAELRGPSEEAGTAAKSAPTATDAVRTQPEYMSDPAAAQPDAGLAAARKAEAQRSADLAAQAARAHPRSGPEQWVKEIEQLFRQGRLTEAQEQLAAFRKRFPDHELPQYLRER